MKNILAALTVLLCCMSCVSFVTDNNSRSEHHPTFALTDSIDPYIKTIELSNLQLGLTQDNCVPNEETTLFATPAAFTDYNYNIVGQYVINGHLKGLKDTRLGYFSYRQGQFIFDKNLIIAGAECAFQQFRIISNNKTINYCISGIAENRYKALCEINGKLYCIFSIKSIPYSKFVSILQRMNVVNAMYLDTGYGWDVILYNGEYYNTKTNFNYSNFLIAR